jgi:diadenosine tetraphosphatase ApaH/serine/threonine PP2A family protein phosphatase
MPIAVISDVHSNLEALTAVIGDIDARGARTVLFLGDAVGYGPDPNECTAALLERCEVLIAGNHDWAALGLLDINWFNPVAKAAIIWTAQALTGENKAAIRGFPLTEAVMEGGLLLVHSSPVEPERFPYLLDSVDTEDAFGYFSERICLVGHSHVPFVAELPEGEVGGGRVRAGDRWEFRKGSRYIINVGSVGQPRDGDPRACYAMLEEGGVTIRRVDYPVRETQRKMKEAGLPEPLIRRLSFGR